MILSKSRCFVAFLSALAFAACTPQTQADDAPPTFNRFRFQPVAGHEKDLVGATVAGSNESRMEGFVTLGEIKEVRPGEWNELKLENRKVYRWLRFSQPTVVVGGFPKVEFYAGDSMVAGEGKGTSYRIMRNDAYDEQSLGYDISAIAAPQKPRIAPPKIDQDGPVDVTMTAEPGTTIRYTVDGSWPTESHGEVYQGPIHIEKGTTFSAAAFRKDRAPGQLSTATYLLPGSSKPGLHSVHLGNSLTGTTGGFWRYARTAGYDHKAMAFLRGGILTRQLWDIALDEVATASNLVSPAPGAAAQRPGASWVDFLSKVGKVDLLTLQPRDFDLDKEIAAEVNFIKFFREKSPDLQPWLYAEWVEMARKRPSDRGEVPSFQMKKTFPALTWEESMGAMLLYVEELQHRLGVAYPEGKHARILPSNLAMGWIKNMIDHGQFPGVKPGSFYPLLFNDQVHPAEGPTRGTANGAYLVDMTWFSAFYHQAPEGKVLPIETNFTPEQARLVERLAWDVVLNYPDCGLYQEGATPCAKPEFSNDGKVITLKSATPGAWFRYTLDGTPPTRTRGYVYCGVISVQPGIEVKAVAYKSGMADSAAADGPRLAERN